MKKLLLVFLSLIPLLVFSEEFESNGIRYQTTTMFGDLHRIVRKNNGKYSGDIVIPEKVEYNGKIWTVYIIGDYAFAKCENLVSVFIPKSIAGVGFHAFYGCSNLTKIVVDDDNEFLDSRDNCNAVINKSNNCLISGCKGSKIPNTIKAINSYAFEGSSIEEIVIPESVEEIWTSAFNDCYNLRKIIVDDANPIYDSRDNCNAIISTKTNILLCGCKETIIPNSITKISDGAFYGAGIKKIYIPQSVNTIDPRSFQYCNQLSEIVVDNNNPIFDSRDNCNAIINKETNTLVKGCKSTIIPDNIQNIGEYSFLNNAELKSISIPANIYKISEAAFVGCNIERLFVKSPSTAVRSNAFSENTFNHAVLFVPAGKRWDFIYSSDLYYEFNSSSWVARSNSWYLFNHIQEVATSTEELSAGKAYILMNTSGYGFYVYDSNKGEVSLIDDYYNVDQTDPNNCWQVVSVNGGKCLYNIGVKKFASISNEGVISLVNSPIPIMMRNNKNGVTLGNADNDQWNFVINETVPAEQGITSITNVNEDNSVISEIYSINGQRIDSSHKGLSIERYKNGKIKKIMKK